MGLFTMKISDEEKKELEELANGQPVGTYVKSLISLAKEGKSPKVEDDGSDGMDWLLKVMGRFSSTDDFVDRLIKYLGKSLPKDIEVLLKNQSDHPLAGYKVMDYAPEFRGWTLFHPQRGQMILSDEADRTHLDTLYDEEMKPLFKVGDVIL